MLVKGCKTNSSTTNVNVFCCKLFPNVKCTQQIQFSFLFKGWYRTLRTITLRRRCYRSTFKVKANSNHTEDPWTQYGSLPRSTRLRPQLENNLAGRHKTTATDIQRDTAKAREAETDGDTQAHTFTQKMDLRVLLAFRQTNCLSVDNRASEVKVRSRPEIHLFTKMRKTEKEKMRKKSEWNRRQWIRHLDRVIEIGKTHTKRGHVN